MTSTELSVPLYVMLLGSAALHGLVVRMMPDGAAPAARPTRTTSVVLAVTEPQPPPPVPREQVAPERAPVAKASQPKPTTPAAATATPATPATAVETHDDVAVDLTGTVLTGGGMALGQAAAAGNALAGSRVSLPSSAASLGPRLVALADLRRAPRAPVLDEALQRHYPPEARRAGLGGVAVLRVQVLATGRTGTVRHLRETHFGFARACEGAVRGASWEPPLAKDGTAVATEITYTCRFEVQP